MADIETILFCLNEFKIKNKNETTNQAFQMLQVNLGTKKKKSFKSSNPDRVLTLTEIIPYNAVRRNCFVSNHECSSNKLIIIYILWSITNKQ